MKIVDARKPSTQRAFFLLLALLLQMTLLIAGVLRFQTYLATFYVVSILMSVAAVLWIVKRHSNPAYKIAWIVPIMLFPVFGGLFYVVFGRNKMSRRSREKMAYVNNTTQSLLAKQQNMLTEMRALDEHAAVQATYIQDHAYYPPYKRTRDEFLPTGEAKYARLCEALQSATRFIFLEYFIIEEGIMWNGILDILRLKASQGVDVRLIYDDLGCLLTLPKGYDSYLEAIGIKTAVFNPLTPVLSLIHNNRDHRKIAIVDGGIGFTGGINLADEYINEREKYGHWKDSAIMLEGEAVQSMTVMFLTMWNYLRSSDEDIRPYLKVEASAEPSADRGFVQPFSDSPLDFEPVGQTVYLNLINKATRYINITTPYLIIDHEMTNALCAAAKGGVEVRIITPFKADKWYVQAVTRSNYIPLLKAGVRIHEYTPGFVHSKTFVVDDCYAVVGTINMDYRSLFLHFECAVWLFNAASIDSIKADFDRTLSMSEEVVLEYFANLPWWKSLLSAVLGMFAPLM